MKIEINKKDYEILLKNIAIGNWVYGIMSDMVSDKYKKEAGEGDEIISKLLKYSDDKSIFESFDGKLVLKDEYMDKIADDMMEYDNYVFWDKLIHEMAKKRMGAKVNLLKDFMLDDEYYKHLDNIGKEFEKNGLKNIYLK